MCLRKFGRFSLNVCVHYHRLIQYFHYDDLISLNHWSSVHVSCIV